MHDPPELDPREGPRRRVAFVITRSDAVGGAQICVELLAAGLQEAGQQVCVFVGGDGPWLERLAAARVPVRRLRHLVREIDPRRDLPGAWELRRALADFRPDIVSTHTAKAGWFGRIAGRTLGAATIHTVHGWVFGWQPGLRATIARGLETATAPLADAIITVCESDERWGVDLRVAPARKFHVVHNALPDLPAELRAQPEVAPPKLITVSRLEAPKDPLTLVEALGRVHGEDPSLDWRLEWIGDGPLEAPLRAAIIERGLEARVELLGARDDVPGRLAKAQVFCLCSSHEGFPISVLEAMRAGLPVVASDVGGIHEAVVAGETGSLAPRGDAEAWAAALRPLIEDAGLRKKQGAAGRARYEAEFTFERQLRRTWAVYEGALRRRRR
jgi:glycosyltransferase involved in cell wall biosynthesis